MKALIVGGGFGGLATAALLSRNGLDVTLIEKNRKIAITAKNNPNRLFLWNLCPISI